jgi:chromobox protein 5
VSLLEPYHRREGIDPPLPTLIDDEQQWNVERILDENRKRGKSKFLVRWEGWTPEHDSWEPEENLDGCRELIEEYRAERRVAGEAHMQRRSQEGKKKASKR